MKCWLELTLRVQRVQLVLLPVGVPTCSRGRPVLCHRLQGALGLAERQARKAGVYNMLELSLADCGQVELPEPPTHVVCNPPWGSRLDGSSGSSSSSSGSSRSRRVWSEGRDDWGEGGDGEEAEAEEEFGGSASGGSFRGRYERAGPAAAAVAPSPEGEDAFLAAAWKSLDGFLYRQCPGELCRGFTENVMGAGPRSEEGLGSLQMAVYASSPHHPRQKSALHICHVITLFSTWTATTSPRPRNTMCKMLRVPFVLCAGASASVISGNPDPFKYLKLKPQSKHRLTLSGMEVQVRTRRRLPKQPYRCVLRAPVVRTIAPILVACRARVPFGTETNCLTLPSHCSCALLHPRNTATGGRVPDTRPREPRGSRCRAPVRASGGVWTRQAWRCFPRRR